jgi:hypothetical protein
MNPFWHLCQRTDYLFIGSSRRKKEDDKYSDIYTDPIVDELHDKNTLTLESSYNGGHLKPAQTKRIAYLDFLHTIERFCRRKCKTVPPEIAAKMDEVQDEINKEFHTELQISKLAIHKYFSNRSKERIFTIVLKRLKPKLVFIVCSYGNEAFIRAAKFLNIPTIEIQHGVINNFHLGYSYNKQLPKSSFPDFFFSFGRTWKDTTDLPVEKNRIYDIGFPNLEMQFDRRGKKVKLEQVLFLSQGIVGKQLSQFAVNFAEKNPSFRVVYKLHPGEVGRWLTDYTSLRKASVDSTITVIDGEEPSLYSLLAESRIQVGVS